MPSPIYTSTHWGLYEVERAAGAVTALRPYANDPDPSPIARSIPAALIGATRLRRPAIRRSVLDDGPGSAPERRGIDPFVEVPWDQALDLVAAEIDRVRKQHGNASIFAGSYGWSSAGRFHHAQSQVHRFMNCAGGYTGHLGSYSLGAARTLMPHIVMGMDEVFATMTAWPVLEDHCKLFVAFGGVPAKNAQVGTGGASRHWVRGGLQRLATAGCRIVNISPVRGDLEGEQAQWLPIRPNTDVALMLGIAHVLLSEGLHDSGFLQTHCVGFERFAGYLTGQADGQQRDAAWAAGITGIDAGQIVQLARAMASQRTMLNASWSLQRADHGEQPYWMLVTLAAMLGQIGLPGGGFGLGYGAINNAGAHAAAFSGPVLPQGSNAVQMAIPVARIADMLLDPGGKLEFNGEVLAYPDIRLVYWAGGNPFHHHQDINRFLRAWRRPETIIVNEQYWTASAKLADVVLPATTSLERDDIGSTSRDSCIVAMKRAIDPVGESRDDYAIFTALSQRLGTAAAYTEGRDTMGWLRHLYDASVVSGRSFGIDLPAFDAFWETGLVDMPPPARPTVMLAGFRADPVAHALPTPSGRIEIASEVIAGFGYDDCPGHPAWLEPAEWLGRLPPQGNWLHLISNQPSTKLHSQYDHGVVSLENKIDGREPIMLHPDDAAGRGLADGDIVRVHNARGACLAGVRLDAGLLRGVAVMATGAWYDPLDPAVPGTLDKHGNPNMLTRDAGTSRLTQGCSAHTTLVEVEKYRGEAPAVSAFDPPDFVQRGA
ncbi:molybdopterin-dependent oxidoreductase [Lacisediminimonas sp.]|uniref:molybdopterin-dependent oxidoreductase n=1 Tax=Lacisediminimonas sp. TaxID=3060582 RepID=UPI00271E4B6F|nr:molybdopterin-dependent oxidoreductase [Lacisediminimonas sp.]MDO8301204.1 molybdopterin-dependent oxidoreductase [Lacisediminimonas sp.]